jgi:hypothetical protein
MSFMIIKWDSGWYSAWPDNETERTFTRQKGGEIMQASISSERQAETIAQRMHDTDQKREEVINW